MIERFAPTGITTPYYAVIFANQVRPAMGSSDQTDQYAQTATRMVELAQQQPGFLGVESTRDADGFGITVSYWKDRASITAWRDNAEHTVAQKMGIEHFYAAFTLRISKVESDRSWFL